MSVFQLNLCSRERQIYQGDANYLLLPSWNGYTGVYAGHAPIIGMLRPGILKLQVGDTEAVMAVGEGFYSVEDNRVLIAVSFAEDSSELDEETVRQHMEEAKTELDRVPVYKDTDEVYLRYLREKARYELLGHMQE